MRHFVSEAQISKTPPLHRDDWSLLECVQERALSYGYFFENFELDRVLLAFVLTPTHRPRSSKTEISPGSF